MTTARKCKALHIESEIKLPGGEGLDDRLVSAIAESIEHEGLREPIVVSPFPGERGKYYLISGRHRLAAMQVLGKPYIEAVIDSMPETQEDADARAITENALRCHWDKQKLYDEYMRLKEIWAKRLEENAEPDDKPKGRGRPKSVETKAREKAAAAVGKTPGAMKEAERRQSNSGTTVPKLNPVQSQDVTEEVRLDERDSQIPDELIDQYDFIRDSIDNMTNHFTAIKSTLTRLQNEYDNESNEFGWVCKVFNSGWTTQLSALAHQAKCEKPEAVCPECKGEGCPLCFGLGLTTKEKADKACKGLIGKLLEE